MLHIYEVCGECGIVRGVLDDRRIYAAFWDYSTLLIVDSVTKVRCIIEYAISDMHSVTMTLYFSNYQLKHCRVGETVRIIDDFAQLHQLQSKLNLWNDGLVAVGQIS